MSVTIRAHHVSITDAIKYVENKLGRLDSLPISCPFQDLDVAQVSVAEERHMYLSRFGFLEHSEPNIPHRICTHVSTLYLESLKQLKNTKEN